LHSTSSFLPGLLGPASAGRQRQLPPPLHHPQRVATLAWSPDNTHLALVDIRGQVCLYDCASGQRERTLHQFVAALPLCCWSPDGRALATATRGPGLWVREASTGRVTLYYQGHRQQIRHLAWSPDGQLLASADRSSVHLLAPALTGAARVHATHALQREHSLRLAWSPNGTHLALLTSVRWHLPFFSFSKRVQIWDVSRGQWLVMQTQDRGISDVVWSPDGRFIATVGQTTCIWSARTGQLITRAQEPDSESCWAYWRGDTLILLSRDGQLRVLHALTATTLAQDRVPGKHLSCAAWSPDGTTLAFTMTGSHTVSFWRLP